MRTYVITTGTVFGLLTIAHILRMFIENPHLGVDPVYLAITAATAGLCVWAFYLVRQSARGRS